MCWEIRREGRRREEKEEKRREKEKGKEEEGKGKEEKEKKRKQAPGLSPATIKFLQMRTIQVILSKTVIDLDIFSNACSNKVKCKHLFRYQAEQLDE